jgi:hypothetical protein
LSGRLCLGWVISSEGWFNVARGSGNPVARTPLALNCVWWAVVAQAMLAKSEVGMIQASQVQMDDTAMAMDQEAHELRMLDGIIKHDEAVAVEIAGGAVFYEDPVVRRQQAEAVRVGGLSALNRRTKKSIDSKQPHVKRCWGSGYPGARDQSSCSLRTLLHWREQQSAAPEFISWNGSSPGERGGRACRTWRSMCS